LTPLVEYLKLQVRVVFGVGPAGDWTRATARDLLLLVTCCLQYYCSFFLPCKG
jgi:hypothetical protein